MQDSRANSTTYIHPPKIEPRRSFCWSNTTSIHMRGCRMNMKLKGMIILSILQVCIQIETNIPREKKEAFKIKNLIDKLTPRLKKETKHLPETAKPQMKLRSNQNTCSTNLDCINMNKTICHSGTCECYGGYSGTMCEACTRNRYGGECEARCIAKRNCSGHGRCRGKDSSCRSVGRRTGEVQEVQEVQQQGDQRRRGEQSERRRGVERARALVLLCPAACCGVLFPPACRSCTSLTGSDQVLQGIHRTQLLGHHSQQYGRSQGNMSVRHGLPGRREAMRARSVRVLRRIFGHDVRGLHKKPIRRRV